MKGETGQSTSAGFLCVRLEGGQLVNQRRRNLEWLGDQPVSKSGDVNRIPQAQAQAQANDALAALNADLDGGSDDSEDEDEDEMDEDEDEDEEEMDEDDDEYGWRTTTNTAGSEGEVRSSGRAVTKPKWMADKDLFATGDDEVGEAVRKAEEDALYKSPQDDEEDPDQEEEEGEGEEGEADVSSEAPGRGASDFYYRAGLF